MVNEAIVNRLLNQLEGYVTELRNAKDITFDKFMKDIRLQRFVERTLQIAIECCFDVAHHVISDEGFREPASYADSFSVLAENNVIPQEDVKTYQMMAKFRNRLVHYYEKVDPVQVYGIFANRLDTFDAFGKQIHRWLRAGAA